MPGRHTRLGDPLAVAPTEAWASAGPVQDSAPARGRPRLGSPRSPLTGFGYRPERELRRSQVGAFETSSTPSVSVPSASGALWRASRDPFSSPPEPFPGTRPPKTRQRGAAGLSEALPEPLSRRLRRPSARCTSGPLCATLCPSRVQPPKGCFRAEFRAFRPRGEHVESLWNNLNNFASIPEL